MSGKLQISSADGDLSDVCCKLWSGLAGSRSVMAGNAFSTGAVLCDLRSKFRLLVRLREAGVVTGNTSVGIRGNPPNPQLPAPRRRFRAVSMQSIKTGPAKGFARKPMAPAFKARARTLSSGKAVIKINGASLP
jgi:hypothetical protein